jgi:hypothetical protein
LIPRPDLISRHDKSVIQTIFWVSGDITWLKISNCIFNLERFITDANCFFFIGPANILSAQVCACISLSQKCQCDIKVPAQVCVDPKNPIKSCNGPQTILDLADFTCVSVANCKW